MNPFSAASQINDLGNKIGNACGVKQAGLNELLQQQLVANNGVSFRPSASLIEDQILDLKTGKVIADDELSFDAGLGDVEKLDDGRASIKGVGYDQNALSNVEGVVNSAAVENASGLTEEQKTRIKEETGWSNKIVNYIESMEQYEKVLKDAGLKEQEVAGKTCLVKEYIDPDYVDPKTGMTNSERMAAGRAPIDAKTGEKIELHHLGQDKDGPLVELCENSEHGDGNHHVLHPHTDNSWRHDPSARTEYEHERSEHWQERAKEYQNELV